jgi:hypothetical protein
MWSGANRLFWTYCSSFTLLWFRLIHLESAPDQGKFASRERGGGCMGFWGVSALILRDWYALFHCVYPAKNKKTT